MSNSNIFDKLVEAVDKINSSDKVAASNQKGDTKPATEEDNSVMGQLLAKSPLDIPQIGDVLEGTVIDVSSNHVLIDLGSLGTGMVLGKEVKDGMRTSGKIKIGDIVSGTLIDFENEDGYIELSIREASYEKSWDDLYSKKDTQEVVSVKIMDANKGGLMTELNGITGFLPVSQLASDHYPRVEDGDKNKILALLKRLVGQEVKVRIIDADKDTEKLIVSEKAAASDRDREIVSQLHIGDVIEGEVSGVVDFGAFVKFLPPSKQTSDNDSDKLEGLVHISELAWQLIDNPREIVKTGDKVKAQIIGIDDTRISLSLKALKKDPWSEIEKKYNVGDVVDGKVDKINPFGAFVYLDQDIHGLAHVSEFREIYPNKRIEEVLSQGETYKWKILSVEPKEHRMGLIIVKEEKPKKEAEKNKSE